MKIILIGLLFTQKEGDFGPISVTERSRAALISKAESHISLTLYVSARKANFKRDSSLEYYQLTFIGKQNI